jgi:rare lipoprotein A
VSSTHQALAVILCFALGGCSLTRRQPAPAPAPKPTTTIPSGSAVPSVPPDVLSIPDAVPRAEPRGTRGNPPFYEVFGKRYHVMAKSDGWVERGTASWYGPGFHAASTSLGEPYDMYAMTAAHKTLPIPCYAEVTNLRNGRRIVVRINDRGPFVGDRIIDLSYTAAAKLRHAARRHRTGGGPRAHAGPRCRGLRNAAGRSGRAAAGSGGNPAAGHRGQRARHEHSRRSAHVHPGRRVRRP